MYETENEITGILTGKYHNRERQRQFPIMGASAVFYFDELQLFRLESGFAGFHRESDSHLEQISVNDDVKAAALQEGQALGNGKSQSAAFCGSGHIAPHESFGQLCALDI